MGTTHFWQHGGVPLLLLLRVGVIQQVWLEGVELGELVHGEVTLHLLLVHHPEGQRLLRHLPVVDLVLHGSLNTDTATAHPQKIPTGIKEPKQQPSCSVCLVSMTKFLPLFKAFCLLNSNKRKNLLEATQQELCRGQMLSSC